MNLPQSIVKWQICGEPVTNKAGGKTAAILDENNSPICFTTSILKAPFDASSYNDPEANRVGLRLEADTQLSQWFRNLDAEMLQLCRQHSLKLFEKQVYMESDLRPYYYSALKENEKYSTQLFKLKMNKNGNVNGFGSRQGHLFWPAL